MHGERSWSCQQCIMGIYISIARMIPWCLCFDDGTDGLQVFSIWSPGPFGPQTRKSTSPQICSRCHLQPPLYIFYILYSSIFHILHLQKFAYICKYASMHMASPLMHQTICLNGKLWSLPTTGTRKLRPGPKRVASETQLRGRAVIAKTAPWPWLQFAIPTFFVFQSGWMCVA